MGLGRIAIAAVLLWSGLAKAVSLSDSRKSADALGLPKRLSGPIGTALPFIECGLAMALLIRPAASIAMLGAAALFAAFTVLVITNLAKGRRPECNCFGVSHSQPIGASTVVRNVTLTLAAAALWATRARAWGPIPSGG